MEKSVCDWVDEASKKHFEFPVRVQKCYISTSPGHCGQT